MRTTLVDATDEDPCVTVRGDASVHCFSSRGENLIETAQGWRILCATFHVS